MANQPTTGRAGGAPSSVLQQANCAACGQLTDCLPRGAYAFLCPACDAGEEAWDAADKGYEPPAAPEQAAGHEPVPDELAPLPDMQLCTVCEELHVGYYRENGDFVFCECWGNYMTAGVVAATAPESEEAADPEPVPDALLPWLRGVVAYARRQ